VPTKKKGFEPPVLQDHRCSPRFIDRTVPHEKELDLYCICLSNFSVIVPSESFVVSATQLGRFGKCPAQIPIAVFTVAIPFSFAIGESTGRYTPVIGCEITDFGETVDIPTSSIMVSAKISPMPGTVFK